VWEHIDAHPWHVERVRRVLESLGPGSVLDVACATGEITARIAAARADRVVGYDGSGPLIAEARKRHAGAEFVEGVVEALPFAAGEYDWVHAGEIVEHVDDPAAFVAALAEVARRGVIMTTPAGIVNDPTHVSAFTAEALRATFAPYFDNVRVDTTWYERTRWGGVGFHFVTATHAAGRPRVLYVADAPFPDRNGYATQTRYTVDALAVHHAVTVLAIGPRRETVREGEVTWEYVPDVESALAFRPGWFARFDRIVFRYPAFARVLRDRGDVAARSMIHVSGRGTARIAEDCRHTIGAVSQGALPNPTVTPSLSHLGAVPICAPTLHAPTLPRVAMVCAIHPAKGVAEMAAAFKRIADRAVLCVVGGFIAEHEAEVPWLYDADRAALALPWVEWVGHVPRAAVVPILRGCSAVLHWNVMAEVGATTAQSTKIAEAMAAGVPVIARRTPGTESQLGPRYPYLCGTAGEAVEAALAIIGLSDARRAALSRRLRDGAKAFSTEAVADEWRRVLGC
jgi:glycosyltransferase involved in cell wall biosynthesis